MIDRKSHPISSPDFTILIVFQSGGSQKRAQGAGDVMRPLAWSRGSDSADRHGVGHPRHRAKRKSETNLNHYGAEISDRGLR